MKKKKLQKVIDNSTVCIEVLGKDVERLLVRNREQRDLIADLRLDLSRQARVIEYAEFKFRPQQENRVKMTKI